ncbi:MULTISPECIES: hypothetical protein [unclassified Ruegeria]|uniref:hypothetical protein n=1 Tax=unclassified Ruegeria TaxID=2625375 RepID=UPI001AE18B83|nr:MULTISPECIES: hypothetical protein [unclassified Ruegeria]
MKAFSDQNLLTPFLIISLAHLLAFGISIYILLPLQAQYTPELAPYASLLFLPHGVRILSAWMMGWKAIPLFAPTALLTHWMNFGVAGFTLAGLAGVFSGIVCAAVTFWTLARIGMDFRITANRAANWRDVMVAGAIASAINTFGMGWAFSHNTDTLIGYFIGDVSGLFACMLILMLAFKVMRETAEKANKIN